MPVPGKKLFYEDKKEKEKEEEYNKFKASLNGDASNNNGYSYYIYGNEK